MHAALLPELMHLCNVAGNRSERAALPAGQHRLCSQQQASRCFQPRVPSTDLKRTGASTTYPTCPGSGAALLL